MSRMSQCVNGFSRTLRVVQGGASALLACAAWCALADDVTGFLSETLVIAPGNGVATNVTETLGGARNVQINDGATGGGIVTLASPQNNYLGGTYIKSGTLAVDSIGNWGSICAIGESSYVPYTLVFGNGTLHYTGPDAVTDRSVLIQMPSGAAKHGAVLNLDHDLTFSGRFTAVNGCLIKTGPGTMTIATPASIPGCRNSFYGGTLGSINEVPNIGANGDGASLGIAGFIILNGRVVIDTPNTVTNYFGDNEFVVGKNSTTASGAETAAYLDIYGGYNNLGNFLAIGRANGNTTTASEGLSSTVSIYGGYTWANNISMGYTIGNKNVTAKPVLNVFGGELRTGYLRLCDHPSQGYVTVNVSGGILRSTGDYSGGQNAGGGKIYINVSSNGTFQCDKNFNTFIQSGAGNTCVIKLFDNGILRANNFNCAYAGDARIEADGGVIKPSGTVNERIVTYLGEKGLTIDARGDSTWNGVIQPLPGVANDGGVTVSGGKSVAFKGALSFSGPITCSDNTSIIFDGVVPTGPVHALGLGVLRSTAAATFPSLTNGGAAVFGFTLENGTVSTITLNDWNPPERLSVYFVDKGTTDPVTTPGTYELLKFPASVPFTVTQVQPYSASDTASYTYAIETSGDVKTLKVTVAAASAPATATWANAAGGDWQTGDNWDGNAVPSSGSSTLASFTTAAQAGGATVTLNSAFTVGGVTVDSAEPYTFAGTGPLTLSGAYMPFWSTLAGAHTVTIPLTLSSLTAFNTASSTTLAFSGVIAGAGGVFANPNASGSGTVALSGANTFSGPFRQGSGTVLASSLANAGAASSIGAGQGWTLGRGTFHYTGPDATIDRPLYLDTGDNYPVNLRLDHDLTLTAPVTQITGDFLKTGPGTLTLAGPGTNILGNASGAWWLDDGAKSKNMIDENGEPTRWHCAVLIADGKVSWGVPGQVVRIPYDEIWVGSFTTTNAGEETTGELEITGGETYFPSHIVIGRNNGLPETIGGDGIARPVVTIRGGYVNPEKVIMCYDNFSGSTAKTYATLNVLGGVFEVNDEFRMGNHKGGGSKATVNVMNGAHFLHRNTNNYHFRMGQGGVQTELNISGAGTLFELAKGNIVLGYDNSVSTINLSDGATIRCDAITKGNGTGYLNLDGGTIQLTGDEPTFQGFTQIRLGANQSVFDATTLKGGSFNVRSSIISDPALNGADDGGFLVRSDTARAVFFRGSDGETFTFKGALIAEAGSTLGISDATMETMPIRLQNGATLRVGSRGTTNHIANITLGESASDVTRWIIHGYDGVNYTAIRDSITVNGTLEFNTYQSGTNLYPVVGTYKLMSGPKGCFDTSKYAMDSRFPLYTATFRVTALDANTDELSVTFALDTSRVHTWQTNGGGTWSTADNWSSLPLDVAGDEVIFPNTLTTDGTITLGGAHTLGTITYNATADTTLSGGSLTMEPNGPYLPPIISTVAGGSLTLPTLSSDKTINVNPASTGSGTVTLGGAVNAAGLSVNSGTIQGDPALFGETPLSLGAATLRFTENGVFRAPLTPTIASGQSLVVRAEENTEIYIDKAFSNNGAFIKTGKGTLYLTGSGTIRLTNSGKDQGTVPTFAANGDAPSKGYPPGLILNGKVVWGHEGQTVNIKGGEFWVGGYNFKNEDGTGMTGELEILGGTTVFDSYLVLGRSHASYELFAEPLRPTVTIRSGDVTATQFILGWDGDGKMNLVATLNVHDGAIFRSKGRFALGNHGNGNHADTLEVVINQYGGEIHVSGECMDFGYAGGGAPSARAIFNQYAGLLVTDSSTVNNRKVRMGRYGARSRMNLHGGVLQTTGIETLDWNGTYSTAEIFWNGGTFRPGTNNLSITDTHLVNIVSTNGACLDLSMLSAADTLTWSVPFTHDAELAGEDGGLKKTGDGKLILTTANSFTGLVKIEKGEVLAQVAGAIAPGVETATGTVVDGNNLSQTLSRIKGTGYCSNGTFRVTQSVAPGASDTHAAGAKVTVENLTMEANTSLICTANDSGATSDWLKVTGNFATEGTLTVDFGRDASNPLDKHFAAKVAEIDGSISIGGVLRGTGAGLAGYTVSVKREGNEIWARLVANGTILSIR
ncbi:MAG: hypothetical protein IJR99_07075 [Kiritimatiellae bacterium]|nr:hypothetical protein [Kiritimatiellia bacterium]